MVVGLISSLLGQVVAARNEKTEKRPSRSRGWGERYKWHSLEDGMALGAKQRKPVMVIVHSMTCSSCINLKRRFSKAENVYNMSDKFIMVNLESYEVPKGDHSFSPDGSYVPRVMFFTPSGYLMRDVFNEYSPEFRFTYSDPGFVIDSMKQAVNIMVGK